MKLLKEPLLHFLVLALGLFVLHSAVSHQQTDNADAKRIVVDRNNLLTFIQYRTKVFNADAAAARLDSLSEVALQRVIDDYVREEALHREARALGLDRDDYVIKRRLIQKIDFVAQGFAEAFGSPSEEEVRQYFEAHRDDYYVEPSITFTHVFFDARRHEKDQAFAMAERKLAELKASGVTFAEAPQHGDRFLYGMNYVERGLQYVQSHFGTNMAQALFTLEPRDGVWYGPFISPHGAHLVMVTAQQAGGYPQLAEVYMRVQQDAQRARVRTMANEATQQIVDSYDVKVVLEPRDPPHLAAADQ